VGGAALPEQSAIRADLFAIFDIYPEAPDTDPYIGAVSIGYEADSNDEDRDLD
jgi:hypothetical protein